MIDGQATYRIFKAYSLLGVIADLYPEAEPLFPVLFCNYSDPPSDWNREPWGERIDIAA